MSTPTYQELTNFEWAAGGEPFVFVTPALAEQTESYNLEWMDAAEPRQFTAPATSSGGNMFLVF